MVENRLTVPDGCPALPAGIYIGYLTLADLDTVSAVNGNILIPPQGQGYPYPDNSVAAPLQNDTPWGLFLKEVGCVCANGEFADDYTANGAKVNCP